MREEISQLGVKWEEWEKAWFEEKERMWKKFESMEGNQKRMEESNEREMREVKKRLEELELRDKVSGAPVRSAGMTETIEDKRRREAAEEKVAEKMEVLERLIERNEREKRALNVVIRDLGVETESGREEVEQMIRDIGVEAEVDWVKKIGKEGRGGNKCMLLVRMKDWKGKKEVMMNKKKLKGKRTRVENDLTPKERRMRWAVEDKVRMERARGNEVRWGYDRMWTGGVEWRWCETEGCLKETDEGDTGRGIRNTQVIGVAGGSKDAEQRGGGAGVWRVDRGDSKQRRGGDEVKVLFWNVAGVERKDVGFWKYVSGWDVVMMSETWLDREGWRRIKERTPKGFVWRLQEASKIYNKGRMMGGMLSAVRSELVNKEERTEEVVVKGTRGVMTRKVRCARKDLMVVGVYLERGEEEGMRELKNWMEDKDSDVVLIGGDCNAWTGNEGGDRWDGEKGVFWRESKQGNKEVDGQGGKILEILRQTGWSICNGNTAGDEGGEITFCGKGETVIDYIFGDERVRDCLRELRVEEEPGSDHFPLSARLSLGKNNEKVGKGGEGKKVMGNRRRGVRMSQWKNEEMRLFRERITEKSEWDVDGNVDGMLERLKVEMDEIKESVRAKEGHGRRKRGWWDESCEVRKEELRKVTKAWRKGEMDKCEYKRKKREYERMNEEKKEEEKERYKKEVEVAVKERREWEVIMAERNKRKGIDSEIEMDEWTQYFRKVLGGVDGRVSGCKRKKQGNTCEERREAASIERSEVEEVLKNLKDGKAAGMDDLENEVFKYGGEVMKEFMWKVCGKVWDGEGWPREWRTGLVVPLPKKGDGRVVSDYRGITLMSCTYKVYAEILRRRLEKEVETKKIIPHNQTGFRRGMGTIDNVFVLNYLINRNLGRKKGKLVGLFIDFKAAFDSVNRKVLWDTMRERGVSEDLTERIKEIYEETICRVRVGGELGEEFWTGRGVRQGCPLSPLLFSVLLSDLEERLAKRGKGGTDLGNGRLYHLAYADDVVLLANDEGGMKLVMNEMEKYVRDKDLTVNVGKSKVMVCKKRRDRNERKYEWRMNGEEVEEVEEFCYLGYWFTAKGGTELQVRKRLESAGKVMGQVWSIGKRRFGNDWRMRVWLFDVLVWSVLSYGVEIWGWNECKRVESMQERFLRWVFGLSWSCPGYIVREEAQRVRMLVRMRKRAWNYEEKLRNGSGSDWARKCLREIEFRERGGREGKRAWEVTRQNARRELSAWPEDNWAVVEERMTEHERQKNWEKIEQSRYNKWYKMLRREEEGIPRYLECLKKERKWKLVAKFRMGEGMNEARYWLNEEEKLCRVCGWEVESWEHVLERCGREKEESGSVFERVKELLKEDGSGVRGLRELEARREGVKEGNPREDSGNGGTNTAK